MDLSPGYIYICMDIPPGYMYIYMKPGYIIRRVAITR